MSPCQGEGSGYNSRPPLKKIFPYSKLNTNGIRYILDEYTMKWSNKLAYAVGLITTDGNLSKDGRHINLTSKDVEQIQNLANILKLKNKVSLKKSSYTG